MKFSLFCTKGRRQHFGCPAASIMGRFENPFVDIVHAIDCWNQCCCEISQITIHPNLVLSAASTRLLPRFFSCSSDSLEDLLRSSWLNKSKVKELSDLLPLLFQNDAVLQDCIHDQRIVPHHTSSVGRQHFIYNVKLRIGSRLPALAVIWRCRLVLQFKSLSHRKTLMANNSAELQSPQVFLQAVVSSWGHRPE